MADDAAFEAALRAARERGRLNLATVRGLLRGPREASPGARAKAHAAPATAPARRVAREPTPGDVARDRVVQLYHLLGRLSEVVREVGPPERVLEVASVPPTLERPGRIAFDPGALYAAADFLTGLAAAVEEAGSGAPEGDGDG